MSFHHNLDHWLFQAKKENCPYCQKADDPENSVTLKLFQYAELCAHPHVSLKGTCYLITREHYVELFDLGDQELLGFMKEVQVSARVLKEVTRAVKINYELHGNTVPHMHLHLFPRTVDDPFAGTAIDMHRTEPPVYRRNEFADFVAQMRQKLADVDL